MSDNKEKDQNKETEEKINSQNIEKESSDIEKKTNNKKVENNKEDKKETKNKKIETEEKEEEEESLMSFSADDDELPDDIKKKLEQNKVARAKKKIIKKRKKKATKVKVKVGKAFIQATYNNTIVTLTDLQGNVISWASAGIAGFRGAKKATPYAASIIVKIASMKAKEEYGLQEVSVFVSGVGTGRESAVRALNSNGLEVTSIKDITSVPHNGCRPKKPRRV